MLEPDLEALRAAVKHWDFSVHEQADRDLLVASYPQQVEEWAFGQLKDAEWIRDMGDFEPLLDVLKWDLHFASHNQRNTALLRQIFQ